MPIDVTELLLRFDGADPAAREALVAALYPALRSLAGRRMGAERAGHTLGATALVHEAYLRLVQQERVNWQSRAHFLAVAASLMRRILVDHSRARRARKRGGTAVRVELEDAPAGDEVDVTRLDEALTELAELDAGQAKIVELRYFGGLTIEETADAMGSSPATVKREWAMARAWLRRALSE